MGPLESPTSTPTSSSLAKLTTYTPYLFILDTLDSPRHSPMPHHPTYTAPHTHTSTPPSASSLLFLRCTSHTSAKPVPKTEPYKPGQSATCQHPSLAAASQRIPPFNTPSIPSRPRPTPYTHTTTSKPAQLPNPPHLFEGAVCYSPLHTARSALPAQLEQLSPTPLPDPSPPFYHPCSNVALSLRPPRTK